MKNSRSALKTLFLSTTICAGFTACSHEPPVSEFAVDANPIVETHRFETDIEAAAKDQVDVFAPTAFSQAQASLNQARDDLRSQKDSKVTLHEIAVGRAYLERATFKADKSRSTIEEVANARSMAIAAAAPHYFGDDFKKADDRLKRVTEDIEEDDMSAKEIESQRSLLLMGYQDLELRAIKQANLGPSRNLISEAEKDGAKKYAPRTYELAVKLTNDVDAYITSNRRETDEIRERSLKAQKEAERLQRITRLAKMARKSDSEFTALMLESEEKKLVEKDAQISAKEQTTRVLAAKNRSLEEEQAFKKRLEDAQAQFNPSEAEVYQQGDKLVVRLKSLEFSPGQSTLKGSNMPLLAKVQQVIKDLGTNSLIIVEGHTDSTGSKAMNSMLSQDRAKAVKEYLVSGGEVSRSKVTTLGYGDTKPISTNKTASGRAENRRVDIVIEPEKK